jgi:D-alanine--poly(phosphoribitol) ligase subunit 1
MNRPYIYNLGQAFTHAAQVHPGKAALVFADRPRGTFQEMDLLSSRLAAWLTGQGLNRGDVACIFHDKSVTAYALMLACLKAGITYCNTDTTSPLARVANIIQTASPKIILYGEGHDQRAAALTTDQLRCVSYADPAFLAMIESGPPLLDYAPVPGTTPAYLMFTSGSTGRPKGAVMSHQNVLNFIAWGRDTIGILEDDVFTNINPMHFDNSVFDFYVSLFNGATLAPISETLTKNPRPMVKYIQDVGCTIWFSVPSMLVYALRLRAVEQGDMPRLRKIIFGGEGFPKQHLRTLYRLFSSQAELLNVYGPTECTCICSSYPVREADLAGDALLPLGPMARNFDFLVVDDELRPVAPGEVGELLIGGPNVGLGYYNAPEQTAAAFIQNPTRNAFRDVLYRSGDLVRHDPDADLLHFAGRKDYQVKRMGYRIELEEIESALHAVPGVEEAACVYVGQDIHACVCTTLTEADLLRELEQLLPTYMMPNTFPKYATLPRNQNGKIDRTALKQELGG